jgi:hypothetical protein
VTAVTDRARVKPGLLMPRTSPSPDNVGSPPDAVAQEAGMDAEPEEVENLRRTIRDLQERVDGLGALEERVRVAEARASDAERCLQDLIDQVNASEGSQRDGQASDDLRTRLARTASKKKPGGGDVR